MSSSLKTRCDYCNKKKVILFCESDENWTLPGSEDHIFRAVCAGCQADVDSRYDCAEEVIDSMSEAMREKGLSEAEIGDASQLVFRGIHVNLDVKEFV